MLLGLPLVQGLGWLGEYSAIFPGLDRREVPMGILLVYLGVAFSLITAVVYTVKGYRACKHAIEHPEEEEEDFFNPEIVDCDDATRE